MNRYGFADYEEKASGYSKARKAIAVDLVSALLGNQNVALTDQHILDAGCGPGTYSLPLAQVVHSITAFDKSEAMLESLRNVAKGKPNIMPTRGSLAEPLPFHDNVFDSVLITQVLHHLTATNNADHSLITNFFQECYRVLKPGGRIVIGHSTQPQLFESVWYFCLLPDRVRQQFAARHIDHSTLMDLLAESGFRVVGRVAVLGEVFQPEAYFCEEGPLSERWRDSNSIFETLSDKELRDVIRHCERLREKSKLKCFMQEHDQMRQKIGQGAFIWATRQDDK